MADAPVIQFGNSDDPSYNAAKDAAGAAAEKNGTTISDSTYKPGVITTSSTSRSKYATNESNLSSTTANMAQGQQYTYVNTAGKVSSVYAQNPDDAMKAATDIAPHSGVSNTTPPNASDSVTVPATTSTLGPDTSTAGADTKSTKPSDDGTTVNDDGTTTLPGGTRIASGLVSVWNTTGAYLDNSIAQAKANLSSVLATLKNDPAASLAIQQTMQMWDQQISAQKQKNAFILGSAVENSARSGGLQYANEMDTNFLGDEQQQALDRITNLVTKETNAVLQTQAAYKKGDVAAFNAASSALDKAQNDKLGAITKLLDESDKILKQKQDAVKAAEATQKNTLSTDVTTSSKIAAGMVAALKQSGITDPDQVNAYVQKMATENGITNPNILAGALATAQQTQDKTDASVANTRSLTAARGGGGGSPVPEGGTDGAFSYSASDISTYTNFLNKGGGGPNGTSYAPRGTDGFVDPGTYVASYQDWINNGGTPQGFVKKFPITNVNPSSYTALPQAIQPKSKTTASAPV